MTKRDIALIVALYGAWLCATYLINIVTTGVRAPQAVFDAWVRYDAIYFRGIAEYGYAEASRLTRPEIGFPYLTAFFPAFPLLLHFTAPLFAFNYSITAVIVPQLLTCLALLALFKLVTLDFPKPVAWFSVASLLVFPTFYFLLTAYSETLFLLLAILTFYFYRQQKFRAAGIMGALASATRILGAPILFASLVLDIGYQILAASRSSLFTLRYSLFAITLVPLGLLAYIFYQWWTFGDAFLFLAGHGSSEWKVGFDVTGPIKGLLLPFVTPFRHAWTSDTFRANYFNSFFFYLGIALLIYGWRKVPLVYSFYALLVLFVHTLSGSLISMPRYLLISFPVFISLGLLYHHHPRLRLLLIPLAAVGLFTTYLFFQTVFLG
jgi:hypothetical protein